MVQITMSVFLCVFCCLDQRLRTATWLSNSVRALDNSSNFDFEALLYLSFAIGWFLEHVRSDWSAVHSRTIRLSTFIWRTKCLISLAESRKFTESWVLRLNTQTGMMQEKSIRIQVRNHGNFKFHQNWIETVLFPIFCS